MKKAKKKLMKIWTIVLVIVLLSTALHSFDITAEYFTDSTDIEQTVTTPPAIELVPDVTTPPAISIVPEPEQNITIFYGGDPLFVTQHSMSFDLLDGVYAIDETGAYVNVFVLCDGGLDVTVYHPHNIYVITYAAIHPVTGVQFTRARAAFVVQAAFVAVDAIYNVLDETNIGIPLWLTGDVYPSNATNQNIIWSIADDGDTGAFILDNELHAMDIGTVVLTATIENGIATGEDFVQDFIITVFMGIMPTNTPPTWTGAMVGRNYIGSSTVGTFNMPFTITAGTGGAGPTANTQVNFSVFFNGTFPFATITSSVPISSDWDVILTPGQTLTGTIQVSRAQLAVVPNPTTAAIMVFRSAPTFMQLVNFGVFLANPPRSQAAMPAGVDFGTHAWGQTIPNRVLNVSRLDGNAQSVLTSVDPTFSGTSFNGGPAFVRTGVVGGVGPGTGAVAQRVFQVAPAANLSVGTHNSTITVQTERATTNNLSGTNLPINGTLAGLTVTIVARQANPPSHAAASYTAVGYYEFTIVSAAAPTPLPVVPTWTGAPGAPGTAWTTQYRVVNAATGAQVRDWGTGLVITGLDSGTTYRVYMRHNADNTNHITSGLSNFTVTTLSSDADLTVNNIGNNNVTPVGQEPHTGMQSIGVGDPLNWASGTVTERDFLGWVSATVAATINNGDNFGGFAQINPSALHSVMPATDLTVYAIWGNVTTGIVGQRATRTITVSNLGNASVPVGQTPTGTSPPPGIAVGHTPLAWDEGEIANQDFLGWVPNQTIVDEGIQDGDTWNVSWAVTSPPTTMPHVNIHYVAVWGNIDTGIIGGLRMSFVPPAIDFGTRMLPTRSYHIFSAVGASAMEFELLNPSWSTWSLHLRATPFEASGSISAVLMGAPSSWSGSVGGLTNFDVNRRIFGSTEFAATGGNPAVGGTFGWNELTFDIKALYVNPTSDASFAMLSPQYINVNVPYVSVFTWTIANTP